MIRKLGFLKEKRIHATYEEHAKLLKLIVSHRASEASHPASGAHHGKPEEVRKITIHMVYEARELAARTLGDLLIISLRMISAIWCLSGARRNSFTAKASPAV